MAISGKEAARQIIDTLPDDASLDDIMYAMYVRKKIERGLRDEEDGNLIDHKDVMRDLNEWLKSAGQL
jgi:predicted transcriptional regulator